MLIDRKLITNSIYNFKQEDGRYIKGYEYYCRVRVSGNCLLTFDIDELEKECFIYIKATPLPYTSFTVYSSQIKK